MGKETIVSLDIGSNKIVGMVAVVNNDSIDIEVAEHIEYEERVVEKGRVVDIYGCTEYIKRILTEIEQQARRALPLVNISIGGGFVRGWTTFHTLNLETTRRKITEVDIENLLKNIRNENNIPQDAYILHLLPQEYIIDEETRVRKNPEGMFGSSIGAVVHVCIVQENPLRNIVECVKKTGSRVDKVYPHSWACAEALLSEEEKESGVLLIDIGKGTTDFLFYDESNLCGTYSIMTGGEHIDSDISKILEVSMETANEIKKQYGWCNYDTLVSENSPELTHQVEVRAIGSGAKKFVTVDEISKIVYDRISDTLARVTKKIEEDVDVWPRLGAGIVLTGGSSLLKGIKSCAENFFGRPVRIASPRNVMGLTSSYQQPFFSSVVGTLSLRKKDMENEDQYESDWIKRFNEKKERIANRFKTIWNKW